MFFLPFYDVKYSRCAFQMSNMKIWKYSKFLLLKQFKMILIKLFMIFLAKKNQV